MVGWGVSGTGGSRRGACAKAPVALVRNFYSRRVLHFLKTWLVGNFCLRVMGGNEVEASEDEDGQQTIKASEMLVAPRISEC